MSYDYRRLAPSEHHACFAGSGECFTPAAYATDNGEGREVYVCPFHREEMDDLEKRFAELPGDTLAKLEALIAEAERRQAGLPPALPQWRPWRPKI